MTKRSREDHFTNETKALSIVGQYLFHRNGVQEQVKEMERLAVPMLQDMFTKVSLRQVARMTKRSASYISLISTGKAQVSPDTFLLLVECHRKLFSQAEVKA